MLEAITTALQLSDAEKEHLLDLARHQNVGLKRAVRQAPVSAVRAELQYLLDAITDAPATIVNNRQDIVAANDLGFAMHAALYTGAIRPGNHSRFVFLDPKSREFYPDWQRAAHTTELRDFARQEHFDPSTMESTVYNADILESTLEVAVRASVWGQPEIEMSIHGHVRQDVVGLEALLRQEVETEMREERDRAHERAIPIHHRILADKAERERAKSRLVAPAVAALPSQPQPERNVVRSWVVGAATTVGLGLVVAYFTHAFGWTV